MNTYRWLIWSIEHNAWWAPNQHGYRTSREQAGRYTYEEALEIVRGANEFTEDEPAEAMCPE